MTPETITAEGLELRPWRPEDADEDLVKACNDPMIARFLPLLPQPYTDESARWWVEQGAPAAWDEGGAAFRVASSGTHKLLGTIGIGSVHTGRRQAEVGYWVAPWARGQGVATRATRAVTEWAFRQGFHRLELLAAKENPASQRVALAAGYTREGTRREAGVTREDGHQDLVAFVRLATDPPGPAARVLPDFAGGELTDGVIRLRPVGPGDVDDLFNLFQLPEVAHNHIGPPLTLELVRQRCEQAEDAWLAGGMASCVIEDIATGAFAGDIALHYRERFTSQAMLGYSLRPEFRGKGFATRAVNLFTEWAFETAGVVRVIAGTFPENDASRAVLQRAGFTREAHLKAALPGRDGPRIDDIQFVRINPRVAK
jgi:RimJ/RimL family protein N-acetyltransferase